jgi:predicted dehydrogenase
MAGHVLRFFPAYVTLANELRAAGPVRSAFFRRRCGAPTWSRWLLDPVRSGGGVFDLLIHDADYCISQWGMPESVRATGYENLSRGVDVVHAELNYAGSGPVIVTGGWHYPDTYPFSMEFTVITDRGAFEWPGGAASLSEYGCDGNVVVRELPGVDPFADELAYFADCAIHGRKPLRCPPEQSAQAVALMRRILESRRRNGEPVPCRS